MSASRAISWWDVLRAQLFVVLHAGAWGLVAPQRLLVPLVVRLDAGRRARAFLAELRERYGCGCLWLWFPLRRTLLVLDPLASDELLASEANAADACLKKRALSRFVPDGVIVSSGGAWRERRAFNEAVLALGRPHPQSEHFARIAAAEVDQLISPGRETLGWADFQHLAERVAHQILLGQGKVEPRASVWLARLSGRANLLLRNRAAFRALHAWLGSVLSRRQGDADAAHCLLGDATRRMAAGKAGPQLAPTSQAGFWFFVLKDAIELHVARTLALLAAHPSAQARARAEAQAAGAPGAAAIEGQHYIEACLLEQLRLWTPVPLLLRRATADFMLCGTIEVRAGQQLLVHAAFQHRDPRQFGLRADRFMPQAVPAGPSLLAFSRHRQSCAGETLVRFVLKAVLAALLARARFTLAHPVLAVDDLPLQINHFALRLHVARDAPAPAHG